jgi:hypothetical protein
MSLSVIAVERLFQRLTATYGAEFVNKWDKVPLADFKAAWGHELSDFANNLNAIGWALENLPPKCPNLIEFKILCKQAPRPTTAALEAPKADVEVVDKELAKIASEAFKAPKDERGNIDHKRWAKKLKAKHDAGEILSMVQIYAYKTALEL